MRKLIWSIVFAVSIVLLLAGAAFGQIVNPQWNKTPTATPTKHEKTATPRSTKTPTETATPTPTETPTTTPTATVTPTKPPPTRTPTRKPTNTPTPYVTPTETPEPTVTPTPSPTPECGHACIPSFIEVGRYFIFPEISRCGGEQTIQPIWHVEKILPSGWICCRDEQGQEIWVQWILLKQIIPVWLVGIQ